MISTRNRKILFLLLIFLYPVILKYTSIASAQPDDQDYEEVNDLAESITDDPFVKLSIVTNLLGTQVRYPKGIFFLDKRHLSEFCWITTTSASCFFSGQGRVGITHQGVKRIYEFSATDRSVCYAGPYGVFCDQGKIISEIIDPEITEKIRSGKFYLDQNAENENSNVYITNNIDLKKIRQKEKYTDKNTVCGATSRSTLCIVNGHYKAHLWRNQKETIYKISDSSLCYAGLDGVFCDNAKRLKTPSD